MIGHLKFSIFVAETPKIPGGMYPPFPHKPKNESCRNQKQNMPNESSYQKMKRKTKTKTKQKTPM